ncbi:MAG: hypothetical protein AUK29_01855 [Nitrospirae bacterium CG2_30_53_67]|nr:MAG: hypothetical protein AUK29_01855 [Nitrospirae bacterium CG2_30_53_67]
MFKPRKLLLLLPVLLLTFLLSAGEALAIPLADFGGAFSFTMAYSEKDKGNTTYYPSTLSLNSMDITAVETWAGGVNSTDPIVTNRAYIYIGGMLTTPYGSPANPFQSLTGGDGVFRITDGTNTYLTGSLALPVDFYVQGSAQKAVVTVSGISVFNTIGSAYLSELSGVSSFSFAPNLTFCNPHANNFLSSGTGSIGGKLNAYTAPPVIPEPSSLVLLGSGVAGLLLLRRKK